MHAFPFNADNIKGEKRTSTGCMEDAKQAIDCGKPVHGIKGPCWIAALKYYDIIEGTAICDGSFFHFETNLRLNGNSVLDSR